MDNRIEKIYEAEKAAVQKRDELAQKQKAKREEVKKAYAAEKEAALSEAEAETSRRLAEGKDGGFRKGGGRDAGGGIPLDSRIGFYCSGDI